MVVHFRARGISQGARKLAWTLMLLIIITKKKRITTSLYKNKHTDKPPRRSERATKPNPKYSEVQ